MKQNYEQSNTIDHFAIYVIKIAILVSILITLTGSKAKANCVSVGSGSWENGNTWSSGSIPACGDTISILAGHTVTVNTNNFSMNSGPAVCIRVYGELRFGNGSKLNLSCNSTVFLESGSPSGRMTAAGGGGSSNQLNICGETVWSASEGSQTGPQTFAGPLPVDLMYFEGNNDRKGVILKWGTATELNNSHFKIERSQDGKTFLTIGTIKGNGTKNTNSEYQYMDQMPGKGNNYYRLTQIDHDGKSESFDVITIKHLSEAQLSAFPNPSVGSINLTGAYEEPVIVTTYDHCGRLLFSKTCELSSTSMITIPEGISGPVILKVEGEDGQILISQPMIINR